VTPRQEANAMKFFKCHVTKKGFKSKEFKEIKKCVEYNKPKCPPKYQDSYKPVKCYPTDGEVA
jgi:hypothetical protein